MLPRETLSTLEYEPRTIPLNPIPKKSSKTPTDESSSSFLLGEKNHKVELKPESIRNFDIVSSLVVDSRTNASTYGLLSSNKIGIAVKSSSLNLERK